MRGWFPVGAWWIEGRMVIWGHLGLEWVYYFVSNINLAGATCRADDAYPSATPGRIREASLGVIQCTWIASKTCFFQIIIFYELK